MKEFVNEAEAIIVKNMFNEDFVVADLAAGMFMSRTVFYTRMKKLTGMAPVAFIRKTKLEYAGRMLRDGRNTIRDVALCVGYSDIKYFRQIFRGTYGCGPGDFRKDPSRDILTGVRGSPEQL